MATVYSALEAPSIPQRYADVDKVKSEGATFTPPKLASFVAKQMLAVAQLPSGPILILDPACGDGALLHALLCELPVECHSRCEVVGFDTNEEHLAACSSHLRSAFQGVSTWRFEQQDFLQFVLSQRQGDLLINVDHQEFDLVIANPPYVRTQILGAAQAKQISKAFGLTGRVDLYYPFLLGIAQVLRSGATTGVITSNRFMTTRAGKDVRQQLLQRLGLRHVWDLGDTKLFKAAVLPAVLVGVGHEASKQVCLSSIYETQANTDISVLDPLAALDLADESVAKTPDGKRFCVRHGRLDNGGDSKGVWRVATEATDRWLNTAERNTWATFSQIGKIHVGVKSTADKVFVSDHWDAMGDAKPELLLPLTTRRTAKRYRPAVQSKPKFILYPHTSENGKRSVVELDAYPKSRRYLESHRPVLEARTYVIEAGRRWYELWVPQEPAAWVDPKLVFLDISDRPTFWMDLDGTVVNGECYWLRCDKGADPGLLWLALAVANSTFAKAFYDHRFNNKLYAGRRRFITQYVELFPLPDPALPSSQAMVKMAKDLFHASDSEEDHLDAELNEAVWAAFGLPVEEVFG